MNKQDKKEYFREMCNLALSLADINTPTKIKIHHGDPKCKGNKYEKAHIHLTKYNGERTTTSATICIGENDLFKMNKRKIREVAFHEVSHIPFNDLEEIDCYDMMGSHHEIFERILNEIKKRYELQLRGITN